MRWLGVLAAASAVLLAGTDARADNPWEKVRYPARGAATAVGGYTAGCVRGAVALPERGRGFERMRPSRRRYFGHPILIDFVRALGDRVADEKLGRLLIGDLGQARGGPASSGHSSHQSGLDVDIWFWAPRSRKPLTDRQRERFEPKPMVDLRARELSRLWQPRMAAILELAARDDRVARIFVNPVIKRELCRRSAGADWLGKIRPWYGHHEHFHVRLRCPPDSEGCVDQAEPKDGDGCGAGLDWWFRDKTEGDRKKSHKKYQSGVGARRELPPRCEKVLAAPPRR